MSSIQQQFYPDDDFGPGERDYLLELRMWLEEQPQDAWLLFVLDMNWDSMDSLLPKFVDRSDCDIAIVAVIFWCSEPSY